MSSSEIFHGLGKIFVSPIALGSMQHQVFRANVKKFGGDLVTKLDSSVSLVCVHNSVAEETLRDLINQAGAVDASCIPVSWIADCVRENRRLEPTILFGKGMTFQSPPTAAADQAEKGNERCQDTHGVASVNVDRSPQKRQRSPSAHDTQSISKKPPAPESKGTDIPAGSTPLQPWLNDEVDMYVRWISSDFVPTSKVAAFDMDGVIIVPKSGKVFPENHNDWRLLREGLLLKKLRSLVEDGHCIVLISNQSGVDKGKPTIAQLREKIAAIQRALRVPLAFLAAYGHTQCRKPAPGMWDRLAAAFAAAGAPVDPAASFFVGDAAGRGEGPKEWSGWAKKDFADTDRKFALNAGIPFHCPESFFLGHTPMPYTLSGLDPAPYLAAAAAAAAAAADTGSGAAGGGGAGSGAGAGAGAGAGPGLPRPAGGQEVVILVGWPGSGKTTLAHAVFVPAGYAWVNRDTLGTPARCQREAAAALAQGRSVVVDNTSPSAAARAPYAALARARGVPARALRAAAGRDLAEHLNRVRRLLGPGPGRPAHADVPAMAYASYAKQYEAPDAAAEGLAAVEEFPFVPRFDSDEARRVFSWRL